MNQKGAIPLHLLLAVIGIVSLLAIASIAPFRSQLASIFPKSASFAATWNGNTFTETFDGSPTAPEAFTNISQSSWDIAVHSRNNDTYDILPTMKAHHGADCGAPLDANNRLVTHNTDGTYEKAVFKCRDHVMTAINGIGGTVHDGYALIYLTPNTIIDLTQGETTIKFDMTTLYQGRDWVDVWITPYDENLQLPFSIGEVDLQNWPKNAIQLELVNANGQGMGFIPRLYSNFQEVDLGERGWTIGAYDMWLTPSPQRRDTFEIKVSKNSIEMCMPTYNRCFFNKKSFPAPLNWSKAIIQFGHHSYTPDKDNQYAPEPCRSDSSFCADTWHWDNFSITPATPFTMIKSDKRTVKPGSDSITFSKPAPANSKLRFSGDGRIEVSFNNGGSWQMASGQPADKMRSGGSPTNGHMASYFVSIPEGTTNVKFRSNVELRAKDFAIWSLSTPTATASPHSSQPPVSSPVSPSPAASAVKPGDVDGNGNVNIFDYNILLTNFNKTGTDIQGDLNNSGKVDIFDYNILLTNFGK